MSVLELAVGLYTYQRPPGIDRDWEREAAQRAEAAGIDGVWFSEHHFSADGYLPSAVPAMADIVARTDAIGVGAGVALLPFHDVPRLAAGLRTLSRTGRRVDYGVGMAYRDEEFDGFGLRRRNRARIFESKLTELVAAVGDEPGLNLWVGAIARPAVERAARLGLPVLFPTGSTHDEIGRRVQWYQEVANSPPLFGVIRDVAVGPPSFDADAWFGEVVDPVYLDYLEKTVVHRADGPVLGADFTAEERETWLERFRGAAVIGGPESLAAEVTALEALGASLCVLRCWFPTLTADGQLEALDRLISCLEPGGGERGKGSG